MRSLGFIISVDAESIIDPEVIRLKLADALTWMEGVDKPDVDFLGDITNYDEAQANPTGIRPLIFDPEHYPEDARSLLNNKDEKDMNVNN